MKITITMTTGNDVFQTDEDIANALRILAERIERHGVDEVSKVMDANGQSVGAVVTEEE